MKYAHLIIILAAFGMLSAGWWVGKVDQTTFVTLAIGAVGGTLWQQNKTQSKTPVPSTPDPSSTVPASDLTALAEKVAGLINQKITSQTAVTENKTVATGTTAVPPTQQLDKPLT